VTTYDRRYQAHPSSSDWPVPARYARLQYAIAVCAMGVLVVVSMVGILVVGAVAGAVLGVDMSGR
jgi:hypothetical protein